MTGDEGSCCRDRSREAEDTLIHVASWLSTAAAPLFIDVVDLDRQTARKENRCVFASHMSAVVIQCHGRPIKPTQLCEVKPRR